MQTFFISKISQKIAEGFLFPFLFKIVHQHCSIHSYQKKNLYSPETSKPSITLLSNSNGFNTVEATFNLFQ